MLHLLARYRHRHPDEAQLVARYASFVEGHADCFKRSLQLGHVTGSAWLLDAAAERVLLTHHRKLNRWLQPGGHADGDSDVHRVAMKEAAEESGLAAIEFVTQELFDLDIHQIPARGEEPAHWHYDCRFLLKSAGADAFTVSGESHDLAWVPFDQLGDYTDEVSMLRMNEKCLALLGR